MPAEKVLIVDDEAMICWSIEETLRAAGYEVFVAGTAAEGMDLFRQHQPEVVLLDVRLPDENGLGVLRRMKESGQRSAVVVMTAFGETYTGAEARRLGAYDYLGKPFEFEDLETLVRGALETVFANGGSGDPARGRERC